MPAPIAWTVYAHRATLASSASDGRHELRVGLRVVSEDDAAQLQNVLNESASTGSQAREPELEPEPEPRTQTQTSATA